MHNYNDTNSNSAGDPLLLFLGSEIGLPDVTPKDHERIQQLHQEISRLRESTTHEQRRPEKLYELFADAFLDADPGRPPTNNFFRFNVVIAVIAVAKHERFVSGFRDAEGRTSTLLKTATLAKATSPDGWARPFRQDDLQVLEALSTIALEWQVKRTRALHDCLLAPRPTDATGSAGEDAGPLSETLDELENGICSENARNASQPTPKTALPKRLARSVTSIEDAQKAENYRKAKGWTVEEFAEKSGVGAKTIRKYLKTGKVGFDSKGGIDACMEANPISENA